MWYDQREPDDYQREPMEACAGCEHLTLHRLDYGIPFCMICRKDKKLSGLQKLCKLYGRIQCGDTLMVWDYVKECAVPEKKMAANRKRWAASERKKWKELKQYVTDSD